MADRFEEKVIGFIKDEGLFGPDEKILLAVSGGADSTAMVDILMRLKSRGLLKNEFFCVHINHQLRGSDADNDEKFVVELCRQKSIEVITKKINVKKIADEKKLSIETAAREGRLSAIFEIAKKRNCTKIMTAHHCDDNAETVLHRMSRGTGFKGLAGIWPKRKFHDGITVVRPLLCVFKSEITEYLKKNDLTCCYDCTNNECKYRRNFIRHKLLPILEESTENNLAEQLFALSKSARKFYIKIEKTAENLWHQIASINDGVVEIDVERFCDKLAELQVEFIRIAFLNLGAGQQNMTAEHYQRIIEAAKRNVTGKIIKLPRGFEAFRQYDKLILRKARDKHHNGLTCEQKAIKVPGTTVINEKQVETKILCAKDCDLQEFKSNKDKNIEWFDYDKLSFPLNLRGRKTGDRFMPIGQKEHKKVGKFLTDAKVPQDSRGNVLVVEDSERIIWLWPVRTSQESIVTSETKKILQVRFPNCG